MKRLKKSLLENRPELIEEWDFARNQELVPSEIGYHSRKKVWWKCRKCGFSWEAKITSRAGGGDCRKCGVDKRKKTMKLRHGSLKNKYPSVAKGWDYERNHPLIPGDFLPHVPDEVYWLCSLCGKSFKRAIKIQINSKYCKECKYKATSKSHIKRAVLNIGSVGNDKQLMKEWDFEKNKDIDPLEISVGSSKKVGWICKYGHKWDTQVSVRKKGSNCPFCNSKSSRFEIRLYCELKKYFPDTLWRYKINGIELDAAIPSIKIGFEVDGSYWHKKKVDKDINKKERITALGWWLFNIREEPLELLDNSIVIKKLSDDESTFLSIIKFLLTLDDLHPLLQHFCQEWSRVKKFKNKKLYNTIVAALPAPPIKDSFANKYPALANEWSPKNLPLTPKMFYPKSNKKIWWQCNNKHEYEALISKRASGTNCPFCANRKLCDANSLAVVKPNIAKQWNYEKNYPKHPTEVLAGSATLFWWKCENNHEWQYAPAWRFEGTDQGNCIKCTSLAFNRSDLIEEWDWEKNKIDPYEVGIFANIKAYWICKECGNKWDALISGRSNGRGCPKHRKRKSWITRRKNNINNKNTIADKKPLLFNAIDPEKNDSYIVAGLSPGSHQKIWVKCFCGISFSTVAQAWKVNTVPACISCRAKRLHKIT